MSAERSTLGLAELDCNAFSLSYSGHMGRLEYWRSLLQIPSLYNIILNDRDARPIVSCFLRLEVLRRFLCFSIFFSSKFSSKFLTKKTRTT